MPDHSAKRPIEKSGATQFASDDAVLRIAEAVQDFDDAILTKNLDGIISSWNRGAESLFGFTAAEIVGQPVTTIIPPDRLHEEPSIIARLKAGERIDHYETVRRCKDGSLIDISLTVSPLRNCEGLIVGATSVARDISDRKRAFEQQKLLLNEMQHRTRNLAAVIEGIARQSRPRNEPAVDAYIDALIPRLRALFSGSELIFGSSSRQASVLEVARLSLSPFMSDQITLDGAEIDVSEHTAAGLSLAFHELATNAMKYGALRNSDGRVTITCGATAADKSARVFIEWKETGGAVLKSIPMHQGFGTRVIDSAVSNEKNSNVTRRFEPTGIVCRFEFTTGAENVRFPNPNG